MSAELESYQYQLSEIKSALAKDPANNELITLRDQIEQLIDLTKAELRTSAPTNAQAGPSKPAAQTKSNAVGASSSSNAKAGPSKPAPAPKPVPESSWDDSSSKKEIKAGDSVNARWTDGKFYPARVTVVGGATDAPIYTVAFTGYDQTELLSRADIKPISDAKKRQMQAEQDAERDKKRKRNEKKVENKQAKAAEMAQTQKSWQAFTKKAAKKGIDIPGVVGTSQFKTPENPMAKVGVVGGGKGMQDFKMSGKHKFDAGE